MEIKVVEPQHVWLPARRSVTARRVLGELDIAPVLAEVSAHRRLRGPYSALGEALRRIVPDAISRCPDLVTKHDIELRTVAPEMQALIPASRETLTSLAVPNERTRYYSRLRTRRVANGLADFLREYLQARGEGSLALVVHDVGQADPTDAEAVAVLLRRLDPGLLRVIVCGLPCPVSGAAEPLEEALRKYARVVDPGQEDEWPQWFESALAPARSYVDADGTSDDPALRRAYDALSGPDRARLHDERAQALEASCERALGALAFHREHGSDPCGAGVRALRNAMEHSMRLGFYHSTIDFGQRGRALTNARETFADWWAFTTRMITAHAALGQPEEAESLCLDARAVSAEPDVHLQTAYAAAMLYTRHHSPERRDHRLARGWINQAIALASLNPDPGRRAFETVFQQNGLALVEVHNGDPQAALDLVTEGLRRLDRELGPGEHSLHRSVLRYNRAQVLAGQGLLEEALADYDAVIELDPNYAEYYLDRGNIHRRLGRVEDALTDYERALSLSPPFPEVFYNRGDVRAELGDLAGAAEDFRYVTELDLQYIDAYVNLGSALCELGDHDAAAIAVAAGLALDPVNVYLLCLSARVLGETGQGAQARRELDLAIAADPSFSQAWATRGTLAFDEGDTAAAIADLTHALTLEDGAETRFNRAVAYQCAGRHPEAIVDLEKVIAETGDPDAIERLRISMERVSD